jgi:hypothetical protein
VMKWFWVFLYSILCLVQTQVKSRALAQAEVRGDLSLLLGTAINKRLDTAFNPDNLVAMVPDQAVFAEVRSNLQLSFTSLDLVLRPKLEYRFDHFEEEIRLAGGQYQENNELRSYWREVFATWSLGEAMQLSWGLQNYQWGPAEAANPSNPIFRESVLNRSILYETRGKHLLRLQRKLAENWQLMAMAETQEVGPDRYYSDLDFSDLGSSERAAASDFKPQALVRLEYMKEAQYAGVVLGSQLNGQRYFGEYASWTNEEGSSVYVDAVHRQGSFVKSPVAELGAMAPTSTTEAQNLTLFYQDPKRDHFQTFAVIGLRQEWQESDFRAEWIEYQEGYSRDEQEQLLANLHMAGANPFLSQQMLLQAQDTGRIYPGKRLYMLSFRQQKPFALYDSTAYLRYLASAIDGSAQAYGHWETAWNDQLVGFLAFGVGVGSKTSEMSGLVASSLLLGLKESW